MRRLGLFFSAVFSLVAFAPSLVSAATLPLNPYEGMLVKSDTNTAVYYVGLDKKRHAFPNSRVFFSWYQNFSKVSVISDFELAQYPLGSNVLYRPGSRLVKTSDVPEVYAVEPGGALRNIPSEDVAKQLYGNNWAKQVDDLDISFFFDYSIAGVVDVIDKKAIYPRGTLVSFDGENQVIDRRSDGVFLLRSITDNGWLANNFESLPRQTVTDYALREFFEKGLPVVTAEAPFVCPACASFLMDRVSVAHTTVAQSPNTKYQISLPEGWGAQFPSASNPESENLLLAGPQTGSIPRSLIVKAHTLAKGESLALLYQAKADMFTQAGVPVFISGPSKFLTDGYEIAHALSLGSPEPIESPYVWYRYMQAGNKVYELQYTTYLGMAGVDTDAIELLLRSFAVDQRIPD